MWIPPQTTVPPGATARSAAGTSAPSGAKMIAASSGSGGGAPEPPAHTAPSRRANSCAASSPGRVKAKTRGPPARPGRRCERRHRSRRGPGARRRRTSQRAMADQPGAEQRRGLPIGVAVGEGEAEARVGDGVLREAAVDVAAGEARALAQVLAPGAAERALAARPAQPRHADAPPVAGDGPDDLVAEHPRRARHGTSPSSRCRSVRQTPHASTRSSSCPGPATICGCGWSILRRAPP